MGSSDMGAEAIGPVALTLSDKSLNTNSPALEGTMAQVSADSSHVLAAPEGVNETTSGTTCGVCNNQDSKYKCSRCELPFCSVACSTLHRATHPTISEEAIIAVPQTSSATLNGIHTKSMPKTVSATRPQNPFTILEKSRELRTLFMVYPRLRSQLRDIYIATLPPEDIPANINGKYEDNQSSHGSRGGGRGGHRRDRGPWTTDRGTQDGIDALAAERTQYGKGGEGIREYSELVLKLVSLEGVDVAKLVQEEVAEENAQIIAQLLKGDSY